MAEGREGGRGQGAALSPLRRRGLGRGRCPKRSSSIAVLDRTKEPGAVGEPLYQDVHHRPGRRLGRAGPAARRCPRSSAGATACRPRSSPRRWWPAVFDEMRKPQPKRHFTVGIVDDVTHTQPGRRSGLLHRRRRTSPGPCSSAWAATARSAPSQLGEDRRREHPAALPRATSSTTPARPAR